jgi:hypothetical protein
MQKQTIKKRKGDTGRTSSQGRKEASGGNLTKKKGDPDRNEDTKNRVKDEKRRKLRVPSKAIVR